MTISNFIQLFIKNYLDLENSLKRCKNRDVFLANRASRKRLKSRSFLLNSGELQSMQPASCVNISATQKHGYRVNTKRDNLKQ